MKSCIYQAVTELILYSPSLVPVSLSTTLFSFSASDSSTNFTSFSPLLAQLPFLMCLLSADPAPLTGHLFLLFLLPVDMLTKEE